MALAHSSLVPRVCFLEIWISLFRVWNWCFLIRNFHHSEPAFPAAEGLVLSAGSAGPAPLSPFFSLSPQPLVAFKMATHALLLPTFGTLSPVARAGRGVPFLLVSFLGLGDVPVSGIYLGRIRCCAPTWGSHLLSPSGSWVDLRDGSVETVLDYKSPVGLCAPDFVAWHFDVGTAAIWCLDGEINALSLARSFGGWEDPVCLVDMRPGD